MKRILGPICIYKTKTKQNLQFCSRIIFSFWIPDLYQIIHQDPKISNPTHTQENGP